MPKINCFYVLLSAAVITAVARLDYCWHLNLSSSNIPFNEALYLNLPTLPQLVVAWFFFQGT